MSPFLTEALQFVSAAAKSLKPQVDGVAAVVVPKITDGAINTLETVVAPRLDVPAPILAMAKAENGAIESGANSFIEDELDLLIARAESLLP